MSALEDILSGAIGKALGGGSSGGGDGGGDKSKLISALIPVVVGLLANGGLQKILDSMKKQGLTAEAQSWVGDGENLPISGDQAKEVVGVDQVKQIADQIGLPEGQAADLIAQALPQVVDKASPEGKEPLEDQVNNALESLKS
jgi:uncharacterized protein YidB (DUF937 family)